jgi:hypothetical protein
LATGGSGIPGAREKRLVGVSGKFTGREVPWWEAQNLKGSDEVRHINTVLSQVDWWNIQPASDRIQIDGQANTQATPEDLYPPQAAVIDDQTWILYLPRGNENRSITLNVGHNIGWIIQWINPRTGKEIAAGHLNSTNNKIYLPVSSIEEDWVCLVKQSPRTISKEK